MDKFLCKISSRDVLSCNIITFLHVCFNRRRCSSLILLSGDIKTSPGSTRSSRKCFSICHWNLNSITALNFAKLSLLTAYNLVHSLILFVFKRHISTLKLHLMTHVWNFQVIICSVLITLPVIKEEVFVFITNRPFL